MSRSLLWYSGSQVGLKFPRRTEHIEIYPIELKLDYKPKRVDYRALREGKTIELMNFFHFDGAEMTLRRIHLSGVSSRRSILPSTFSTDQGDEFLPSDYWLASPL